MDRRQFLRLTGGSAASVALTAWFAAGCSRRVVGSADVPLVVPPASDRPLLLLIVPKEEQNGWERGEATGSVLNHGGDQVLADFAAVELVCSTADRLPAAARTAAEGEPWFVLVAREGGAVRAHAFTPDLPPKPPRFPPEGQTWKDVDAAAEDRVRVIADQFHAFLAPHLGPAPADLAARAGEARSRYVAKPPPGAHWAHSGGCGMTIEGVRNPSPAPACGMGMVPEVSRRFLTFYVKD